MLSLAICFVVFASSVFCTRRSLVAGLASVLVVGYGYGIARSHLQESFAHFIFDAAVLGLYVAFVGKSLRETSRQDVRVLRLWMMLLIAWPTILLLVPWQDPLIQIVGLRGNAFLLPFLLLGGELDDQRARALAMVMAVLNVIALGFGGAEYVFGVERFVPYVAGVTDIVYDSTSIEGLRELRIPSVFTSSHAYGGTMVLTLPWIFGAWVDDRSTRRQHWLLVIGIVACLLGIFMSAARIPVVVLVSLVVVATILLTREARTVRVRCLPSWLVILVIVGGFVASDERLQRFKSLEDTEAVTTRVAGSVNMEFWEVMSVYPLGNGLGGGGTSIPYFWQDRIKEPVVLENEYARILLEQGMPGLALWIAFMGWLCGGWLFGWQGRVRYGHWYLGRHLLAVCAAAFFATGLIGIGLLTSIPGTSILLLGTGWIAVRPTRQESETDTGRRRFGGADTVVRQRSARRN